MLKKANRIKSPMLIQKSPTGISGLDEITVGGLPKHRCTLISGGAGSGKSMLSLEFLLHGATLYNEPGLFLSFEETEKELTQNIASLGFDVNNLVSRGLLVLDHIKIDQSEFAEIGSYNLDGLFIRLKNTINKFKIKRVALDTLEILFGNFANKSILRAELQRLFRWFKSKKITLVVTAERGENTLTNFGLEEYVADCVIYLDNRMENQLATRRIRIAKYRGSSHGCNEYPFTIGLHGINITSITSVKLDYQVSTQCISTGIEQLDTMLDGRGFYRGSSILISGPAGCGKSSFATAFVDNECRRGQKCFYISFEESVHQIVRNMKSIGFDLNRWIKKDLLRFYAVSPNSTGLESHMSYIQEFVRTFKPSTVVIDPISNLKNIGNYHEVHDILSMLVAFFKKNKITVLFTSLIGEQSTAKTMTTMEGISSIIDTWISLQYIYGDGERNRAISILKSRGMNHSNQLREIIFSSKGISLQDVYIGNGKVLMGAARLIQANKLEIENVECEEDIKIRSRKLQIKRKTLEAKIAALTAILESANAEREALQNQKTKMLNLVSTGRSQVSRMRMADSVMGGNKKKDSKHGK